MEPKKFEKAMKDAVVTWGAPKDLLDDIASVQELAVKRRTPVDTGTLQRSIAARVSGNVVYVGSDVVYAPYVHEGTQRMEARPFIDEGLEDSLPLVTRMMAEYGDKVFQKVGHG